MSDSVRCILHADMDAFYAAIEQRDDPELRGRPVIVGGMGPRGVVSTASYEARRFGVHSAMPGAEARRRCPDGVFVPPRMDVYVGVSEQVFGVFGQFTPEIEGLSLDEAFLDVTASRALFGDGRQIAERVRFGVREATGLTVSIGVATNKFVAKVASDLDKPDGVVVVEAGTECDFLAPLPVSRLFGAGKVMQARLRDAGLETIGDLQRADPFELERAIGEHSAHHFRTLALAEDNRPVVAERRAKSISHECTFDEDVRDIARCREVLLDQAERVGRRLRRAGRCGRVVKLKLRFPPFETHVRQSTLDAPTDDDLRIYRTARALFDASHAGRPIRLLGLGVTDLESVGSERGEDSPRTPIQGDLFRAAEDSLGCEGPDRVQQRSVTRAMDAIRDRFGEDKIRRGR